MSLIDELLQSGGPQDKLAMLSSMMGGSDQGQGGGMGGMSGSPVAPPGAFGNDSVDVLQPNDPRLVTRFGVTLAKPAMHSLADIVQQLGYHGDVGGGYRSPQGQADIYAQKPGLAAPPGSSYHQEGLALDLASALQNAQASKLFQQAGWNQFSPSGEPWHWSYGVTG